MSLATRCPACHTVFRVVQDQLRVSEGWVRCGQCQEVFNALETLFDLGPLGVEPAAEPVAEDSPAGDPMSLDDLAAAPVAQPAPRPTQDEAAAEPAAEAPMPAEAGAEVAEQAEAPAAAADVAADLAVDVAPETPADIFFAAPAEQVEPEEDDAEAPTPSRFMGPAPDWAKQPTRGRRNKKSKSKPTLAASETQAQEHHTRGAQRRRRKPEFVRQAERAAMWRRPAMRALLGGAALLLAAMFTLQVGYQYRDPLAAQVPSLAPGLRTACAWMGCRISPPRAIERIRLDAHDLTRTDEDQVLRLMAEIHNTAEYAVRTPALDVSFTDPLGRTVSRKVMTPTDLGARSEALEADGHWRVDARLAVGDLRISGYTVEVFYP